MSGSGGSEGGVGTGFSSAVACEKLVVEAQLNSPKQAVVSSIKIGDKLAVKSGIIGNATSVYVEHKGSVAGGLAFPGMQRLRECLDEGVAFEATVLSIKSGQVRVRVTALP